MMKLRPRDWIMIAVAVVIILIIALFGFPNTGSTEATVKTSITIEFANAPTQMNQGKNTTWNMVEGNWISSLTNNSQGETVWKFENVTSKSSCYDQLMAAAHIAAFEVESQNQTLGLIVTSIGACSNLEFEGRAWQYYVNGVYANRACNIVTVANGDHVVWKYQPNQMG
ncbi:MAG: DUF4430 domain-containing protein [Methanomassiliicoccales archaeon]|jgi:hypothetical protein